MQLFILAARGFHNAAIGSKTQKKLGIEIDNSRAIRQFLEELAEKMKVPAGNLQATVARYNELVKQGVDEDFGKRAELLFPLEQPPFYAGIMKVALLATVSGLSVNSKSQVLDAGDNPIPGLHAVGNVAGEALPLGGWLDWIWRMNS